MFRIFHFLVIAFAVVAAGCKTNKSSPEPSNTAQAAGVGKDGQAETAPAAPAGDAGPKPLHAEPVPADRRMANCPSAVPGATTAVSREGTAVAVVVTSADATAVEEIRRRAELLANRPAADAESVSHSGGGSGGGQAGKCPVVRRGAKVSVQPVESGVKITLSPSDPSGLAALEAEATQRAAELTPSADGSAQP